VNCNNDDAYDYDDEDDYNYYYYYYYYYYYKTDTLVPASKCPATGHIP